MQDRAAPPAATDAPARPASTLIVVREASAGLEVLLLRRAERGDHASGAWVFPGGVLDARDRDWHRCCGGLDDSRASAQLGMPAGGLDYHVAAIRECFEEAGLLLARDRQGRAISLDGEAGAEMLAWRGLLHRGERTLGEFCDTFDLTLAPDLLAYHTRWVTPTTRAKRWDARFFFVAAPEGQQAAHDAVELVEQLWLTPAEALARSESLKLLTPTRMTLESMAAFADVGSLLAHVRSPRATALQVPRVANGAKGMLPVAQTDHAWAEIGKLDPQGHGNAFYDIEPGRPVKLSDRVIRVTADNPHVMTGPGTNSYLVGALETNEWAAIDPGPDSVGHLERLKTAAPGPIRWILVTHTHEDHSPGAARLAAMTGAPVLGQPAPKGEHQDENFKPTRVLQDGERLALSAGTHITVIHTPGHASNHLCFLLDEEGMLFTGDHLMQGSTVVIHPPDGDMSAYMASLRGLLARPLDWLAPGHGFLIAEPHRAIEGVVAHRLKREAKVESALRELGPAEAEALVPRAYDDTPPAMHGWALHSLTAHLLKLRDDGRARLEQGVWSAVA